MLLPLALLIASPGIAQQPTRPVCDSMLRAGIALEKDGELSQALQQYLNALNCDTRLAEVVGPKIQQVFEAIEAQREREAQAKRAAESRRREAETEKRRAKSNELAARALLTFWRDRDATRSFRYAQYAYSYDTTNADAVSVLYGLYFSRPSSGAVPDMPMYFNAPGNLWRDFTFFVSLRGEDSLSVSPFAAFDRLFPPEERPVSYLGYGGMPPGTYRSAGGQYRVEARRSGEVTSVELYWYDGAEYRPFALPRSTDGLLRNVRIADDEQYLLAEGEYGTSLYWMSPLEGEEPVPQRVATVSPPDQIRVERHGEGLFVWIENIMGPFTTIYRLSEGQLQHLKTIEGWIDTYGSYLSYRERNTNRRVIDRLVFDLENVLIAEDLPYRFDFGGLPLPPAGEQPAAERPAGPKSRRYVWEDDERRAALRRRGEGTVLAYALDTSGFCNQSFDWDHTPDERYAMLTGDLYIGGEGGAGCPFGQVILLWDDQLRLSYTFPRTFMGLDDHEGGEIRFDGNRHVIIGGYRWMLDPKAIIRAYHQRGYRDFSPAEKRAMGIREGEMQWRM